MRLEMDKIRQRIPERVAAIKKLADADPAYATLLKLGAQVRKRWAARPTDDELQALALALDDAWASDSRRAYEGCDETTWQALAHAVGAIPAKRLDGVVGTTSRPYLAKVASILLDDEDVYLAANARGICARSLGGDDAVAALFGAELEFRSGARGPRTATQTEFLAAGVEFDDRTASLQFERTFRPWRGGAGFAGTFEGVVTKVVRGDGGTTITFAKQMVKVLECTVWKATNRVDRIDDSGHVYYAQVCVHDKWSTYDSAPKPTTVSARFEAGLKKGAFVTLYGGTVGAVWAKEGAKTPLVVFGVALR
ncbi:MAG: hypothetical protein H6709_08800 [Kofleriaceae bacterium]|nr:hypothetical protein [Myxococcales bacterium]MCB9565181.1 hypothetical protein [Kofleriaceae bacterium]MCB9572168.1 hypothetical protein [Kofleriaceae bacterium]